MWYTSHVTYRPPIHGILTPYPWYEDPLTHGVLTHLLMVFWSPLPMLYWPPINGILNPYPWYTTHLPMVFRPHYPWYFEHLPMVYRPPYPWYFDTPIHGILTTSPSIVFWPPYPWYIDNLTHGISTPTMVYRQSYPWYIDPYPWYFDPLSMVFWPPTNGIWSLLPMVFWPPTNGIWSPIPMVYRPTTHCILIPLPMVYRPRYPWYFYPPAHGISNPLPMVFLPPAYLLIRNGGVKIPWRFNLPYRGVNIPWHRSFLHSWPITGFVIRLTRRVPLVEQEQLTFPEHPSSVPVFSGVCVTRSLVLCVCFVDHCLSFFAIMLSVLRFTDSYYPFRLWYLETLLKKSCYSFPNRLLC
jgi:hypothetical protein